MTRNQQLVYLLLNLFWIPCIGQWSQTSMSAAKVQMGATTYGNQIFLAGGNNGFSFSPRVDVYNLLNNEWSILTMTEARALPAAVTLNDEIIFAGGYNLITSSTVDVFNAITSTHTTYNLSKPRMSLAAVIHNDIAMFAGGATIEDFKVSNRIDIYDQSNHKWTIDSLSQARAAMGFGVLDNKAYFAGGYQLNNQVSDRIDIYNFETKNWETASLSVPRGFLSSAVVGSKIIFAGGMTADNQPTDQADIYDSATQMWTTSKISVARAFTHNGVTVCDKAFFIGGSFIDFNTNVEYQPFNVVDIYNAESGSWTHHSLPQPILANAVTAGSDFLISAGGATDIVTPETYSSKVNIYNCNPLSTHDNLETAYYAYPNPCSGNFILENNNTLPSEALNIQICDSYGNICQNQSLNISKQIDMSAFPNGLYYLLIMNNDGHARIKKSIMIIH